MSAASEVAVVVLIWRSRQVIADCLRAALAEEPGELVVIDNGSEDGAAELVARDFPTARLVRLGENRGFAGGCNAGIDATTSPYVLLLNDDCVLEPGYIHRLAEVLDNDPKAASAVGKLVYDVDGVRHIDSAGIELNRFRLCPEERGHGDKDEGQFDKGGEVWGPSAAAAMYRRRALETVGPPFLDEALFAYYEDVDLAWRLRRRGFKHLYVPSAVAQHGRRGPEEKGEITNARAFANRYLVWIKNESPLLWAAYSPVALPWEIGRVVRRALSQRSVLAEIPRAARLVPSFVRKRWR